MASRVVVFGATGYTGRLIAERLAAAGVRPVLAARSEPRLADLAARLGGLELVRADALRANTLFEIVGPDDVLVSTVGPFVKWGAPAVRPRWPPAACTSTRAASRSSSGACSRSSGRRRSARARGR